MNQSMHFYFIDLHCIFLFNHKLLETDGVSKEVSEFNILITYLICSM